MKKFLIACFLCLTFVTSVYASCNTGNASSRTGCAQALPTSDPSFCPSFKTVATCHCVESGLPKGMCQDMNKLYSRMIAMFGSLEKACAYQHDTSKQTCIDDWNCYRTGGSDSMGRLCSGTGKAC